MSARQPSLDELETIRQALADGRKIEAIKLYREATGASLAEAKAAVEAMENMEQPRHGIEDRPKPIGPSSGCAVVLAAGLVLLAGVVALAG